MKKILLITLSLVLLAAIAGCLIGMTYPASRRIHGSGKIESKTIPAPDFEQIAVSRAIHVVISDELRKEIRIETDDNLMEHIVVKASDGKLRVTLDPKLRNVAEIHATVTVPANGKIKRLAASSAAKISCRVALAAEEFELIASSASEINAAIHAATCSVEASSAARIRAAVETTSCRIEASSSSKVELSGTTYTAMADLSSAAKLIAGNLIAERWNIETSSASKAQIHCTKSLRAEASSGSTIRYAGDCSTDITKSSGGSVRR